MIVSNVFSLTLLIIFMGYGSPFLLPPFLSTSLLTTNNHKQIGLCTIPRVMWRRGNIQSMLRYYQFIFFSSFFPFPLSFPSSLLFFFIFFFIYPFIFSSIFFSLLSSSQISYCGNVSSEVNFIFCFLCFPSSHYSFIYLLLLLFLFIQR